MNAAVEREDSEPSWRRWLRRIVLPCCIGVAAGVVAFVLLLPLTFTLGRVGGASPPSHVNHLLLAQLDEKERELAAAQNELTDISQRLGVSEPEIASTIDQLSYASNNLTQISQSIGAAPSEAPSKVRQLQTELFSTRAELLDKKWPTTSVLTRSFRNTSAQQHLVSFLSGSDAVSARLKETEFSRTPHIDGNPDQPLQPGQSFEVRVYLDNTPTHPGEQGSNVVLSERDLPEVLRFSVWLDASPQFDIGPRAVQDIQINRNEDKSSEAIYQLTVRNDAKDIGQAKLTAHFSYNQRPVGFVTRQWQQAAMAESGQIVVDPAQQPPDLTITIVTEGAGKYRCTVSTPHLVNYDAQPEDWALNQKAEDFVKDKMGPFTESQSPAVRLRNLQAAGISFYDAAPENFKNVLWELIRSGHDALKTIYIVTDEPFIPWELMIPSPPNQPTVHLQPLGVEFTVGRWITNKWSSPPQRVPIDTALIVAAPFGDQKEDSLAADEVSQVVKSLHGEHVEHVEPPTLDKLEEMLTNSRADVLHFVCHGKGGIGFGRQILSLAKSTELDSTLVRTMDGFNRFFTRDTGPVVFLNACEVGSLEPALVGVGGFAKEFATLKAGAVIAPLWSVKHIVAHDVAQEFYDRLSQSPTTPLASIIRDIRRKAYVEGKEKGEDSYAAYCFYGDPLCTRERVVIDNTILTYGGYQQ